LELGIFILRCCFVQGISIEAILLTTEAMIAAKPEEKKESAVPPGLEREFELISSSSMDITDQMAQPAVFERLLTVPSSLGTSGFSVVANFTWKMKRPNERS
jgi:hypothetical protein